MKDYRIADLFCGAGGTSAGAVEAIEAMGRYPQLTAVNHWPVAVATHETNHPAARSICTGVDEVNPRSLFPDGKLDLLWASPECTHHSIALGGRPINDQSRSTAWCVPRWAEALQPDVILVENVPEFATWGPIGVNGRPLKSRKGETFQAWLNTLRALGYKVDHRLLCAADFGDPTTRTRLFVQAVRGRRRIVWPEATHSKVPDLLSQRRWTPAREIIDWTIPAKSIFERERPLSPKTMARIEAGLRKFGLKGFIVPNFGERAGQTPRTHDLDAPVPAVTSHGAGMLIEPFLLPQHSSNGARSVDDPAPTVTTTSRGVGLCEPFLVSWDNQGAGPNGGVRSVDEPVSTIVTKARHGVAEPFLVAVANGGEDQYRSKSLDAPLPTVTAGGVRHGLAEPFLVELRGTSERQVQASAKCLEEPCSAVTTSGAHHDLVEPFLVKTANGTSRAGEHTRARDLGDPLPTVCTSGDVALVEPFLIKTANGASGGSEAGRAKGLDEPAPTICGNRGDLALIEPCLLGQQSGSALRPLSEPAPTVSTAGAVALVEPFLVSFYGNGQAHDLGEPAPTVTCKDRFALVRPVVEIDGARYLLDIRFRMLQPHELALAQGFPRDYRFTGTKTEQVKQIGNAVPRRLARAIVAAVVSQCSDVSALVDAEEGRGAAA